MAFWSQRRVLVTGAGGFLGGWLAYALLEREATVVALLHREKPLTTLQLLGGWERVYRVYGSVTDEALLREVLNTYEVDTCFHLAAQPLVGAALRSPVATFEANVRGTWLLLEQCRLCPTVERVVVASSDKAYGPQVELPFHEATPLRPRHPYEASKACADLVAQSFAATYGLPLAITRCANLYGGGDLHPSRLIPETIRALLEGRRPLLRSDGSPRRDFLYIEDAVRAYLLLAERLLEPGVRGEAFNFGTGQPRSVLEVVETLCRLTGRSVEPEVQGRAVAEIPVQFLDASKARERLGWEPQVPLEEGLRRTWEWYCHHAASLHWWPA